MDVAPGPGGFWRPTALSGIGPGFAECHIAIPVGIGFAAQRPQQIVCEQAMPMLVVLQPLSDVAGSNDMDSRTPCRVPLGDTRL